jgi:hypothetical protein
VTTRIALIQPPVLQDWEHGEIDRIRGLIEADPLREGFELTTQLERADLVVVLESCSFKTRHDIPAYQALLAQHGAERLFCINYEDGPPGFLPGLHSSLESFRLDEALHLSWPHLKLPNEQAERQGDADDPSPLDLLFTFSGACSHPLRRRLFDNFEERPGRYKVREIKRWYDHNDTERLQYVVDIRNSKFVLCPRGIASYSHRILETMALGRVPVVIADDWVPFSIAESGYCLRIAEADLQQVERLLQDAEAQFPVLQAQARAVFTKYFAPARRYTVALSQLASLHARVGNTLTAQAHLKRWNSRAFWQSNGWCVEQRVVRKLRKLVAA